MDEKAVQLNAILTAGKKLGAQPTLIAPPIYPRPPRISYQ
jgi:hypothetical protein